MADDDFNEFENIGFGGPPITNENYYTWFLGHLNLELCHEIFGGKVDINSFTQFHYSGFTRFQKWCRVIYEERNDNPDKTYFFFRDVLVEFQLSRNNNYFEKEGNLYHVLLAQPLSTEGDSLIHMAIIIYEFFNQAISCLQDYVKLLTPKSVEENPPLPPLRPAKLRGFRIKNKDFLATVFSRLRSLYIIHSVVRQKDFEDSFSGWVPENKITWLKGPGLLSYFIKSINGKGIEDEGKNIWITTMHCFQDENMHDYNKEQLRFAKKPTKTEDIDLVIKAINRNSET
jgi:hypothetical protein